MNTRYVAAAVQLCAGPDKEANLALAEQLSRRAVERGAALVVLPEVFSWRGPRDEETQAAEAIPGPTTDRLAALARDLGAVIVGGSILERASGADKVYNTCTVYTPEAGLVATYRKIHLFDVELANHFAIRESDTRLHGADVVVAETRLGKIGLSVCYDLRFPELFRRLTAAGAEIVCLPSAFTFPTGAAHWEILVRARAIENQVYFIAPNQHGRSPSGHLDYGHSLIADPWGTPLARAGDGDGCITAEIDLDYLARVRRELPCLRHRTLTS